MRLTFTHLKTLEQALTSLQQMARRVTTERSASGRTLLRMSMDELKKTIVDSLRQYTWHTTWLLEGWKQEGCLALAAVVSRLVSAVAARPGTLLAFVPELYLESALDMVRVVVFRGRGLESLVRVARCSLSLSLSLSPPSAL